MKPTTLIPFLTATMVAADFHILNSACKEHIFCPSADKACKENDDPVNRSVDLLESNRFNCGRYLELSGATVPLELLSFQAGDGETFETTFCDRNLRFTRHDGDNGFDLTDVFTSEALGNCVATRGQDGSGDPFTCSGGSIACNIRRIYICFTQVCN